MIFRQALTPVIVSSSASNTIELGGGYITEWHHPYGGQRCYRLVVELDGIWVIKTVSYDIITIVNRVPRVAPIGWTENALIVSSGDPLSKRFTHIDTYGQLEERPNQWVFEHPATEISWPLNDVLDDIALREFMFMDRMRVQREGNFQALHIPRA